MGEYRKVFIILGGETELKFALFLLVNTPTKIEQNARNTLTAAHKTVNKGDAVIHCLTFHRNRVNIIEYAGRLNINEEGEMEI